MSSSSNLRTLTAILVLASVTAQLTGVAAQDTYLRKRGTRKLHRAVHHAEKAEYKKGLEEDVVFWTNLVRKTQEMSLPPDSVPTPTNPPVPAGTGPPVGSVTSPPVGTPPPVVVDPTEPPVAGPGGDFPTYPPVATPAPVGSVTSPPVGTPPPVVVDPTAPPVVVGTPPPVGVDPTEPPVAGPGGDFPTYPPVPTPAPVGSVTSPPVAGPGGDFPTDPPLASTPPVVVDPTGPPVAGPATIPPVAVGPTDPPVSAFKCPDASFVLCTAPDPTDFQDECPVVGEPCPDGTQGEYCCLDLCPRKYCTAKQAPMSLSESVIEFIIPLQNEVPGSNDLLLLP